MDNICNETNRSSNLARSDCSPFLNWNEEKLESEDKISVVYRSLVATVKLQPSLDVSLEGKAVKFLKSVDPRTRTSADAFVRSLASSSDDSSPDFVQCIGVLLSSASQLISRAAMQMIKKVHLWCSPNIQLALVKADLIPQLINTLTPLSLSLVEGVHINTCLMTIIRNSTWLTTPYYLRQLEIEDHDGQQAVRETVFQQVLVPSEKLLEIYQDYQPAMKFILHMPIILMIPSCLAFFETDEAIYCFLHHMVQIQWKWNDEGGEEQQMWKTVHRMLRMEGIEDVIEEKLQNDKNGYFGGGIVDDSIIWSTLLGMNLSKQE
ncbi:hypothetical protein BLNAU_16356 [Blattamonas nauphoetae]|uniref:Uncharacterized protein n=1 Tax=Blattamonas nauphoetae TaxID=2049346 RepID=A0ABQ9X8H2_9EUKA|nr:hypothetical protein BLNAU_16356 [Blattamonas nauphoetae]